MAPIRINGNAGVRSLRRFHVRVISIFSAVSAIAACLFAGLVSCHLLHTHDGCPNCRLAMHGNRAWHRKSEFRGQMVGKCRHHQFKRSIHGSFFSG